MSDQKFDTVMSIPPSGIAFASGASLVGAAVAGPVGAMVGAIVGGVGGVAIEIASSRKLPGTEPVQAGK